MRIKFFPGKFLLKTSGTGLWSKVSKEVDISEVHIDRESDDEGGVTFVKLFPRNWNNDEDGLIYTDPGFLREVRKSSAKLGLDSSDCKKLDYTEQGLQGGHRGRCPKNCMSPQCRTYVHMIVGGW